MEEVGKSFEQREAEKNGRGMHIFSELRFNFLRGISVTALKKEARTKEAPNVRAVRLRERAREIEWNEVKLYLKRVTLARIP